MVSLHRCPVSDFLANRRMAASSGNFELRVEARLRFEWILTIPLLSGRDSWVRVFSSHILALLSPVLWVAIVMVETVLNLEFHPSRHWLCSRGISRRERGVLVNSPVSQN
jgi:hypothetical protein